MTPVMDPDGTMRAPDLHGGLLLGIVLSPDREDLTLFCRTADGTDLRLTFPGLVRLRVDNFLEGNIIFEVSIRAGDRCPPAALKRVWDYDDNESRQHLANRI